MLSFKTIIQITCDCGQRADIYTTRQVGKVTIRYWRCQCGTRGKHVCTTSSIDTIARWNVEVHNIHEGGGLQLDTSRDSERNQTAGSHSEPHDAGR